MTCSLSRALKCESVLKPHQVLEVTMTCSLSRALKQGRGKEIKRRRGEKG